MKDNVDIVRINSYDDIRFSKTVLLQHGAYLISGEPYEVEIIGEDTALIRGASEENYYKLIKEFRFNAPQIVKFTDLSGSIIAEYPKEKTISVQIDDIQPSQFFVDEAKMKAVESFIHNPDDIIIQVMSWNDKYISLDGHTRLFLAVQRDYSTVKAVLSEAEEWVWPFVNEAIKRKIRTPKDMELLSHEQYEIQWNEYCDSFFENC